MENVGKKALIRRELYFGKATVSNFQNHLRVCMQHLDFASCLEDSDFWMKPAKKSDRSEYYEYFLLDTDDVLVVSKIGEKLLREGIVRYFELKEEYIGSPQIYLGGHVRKVELENGPKAWAFISS